MKRGFTLIELLVTLGIIAALIGLLLPTLASARNQARKTVCISNVRQLALAFSHYAQHNRDFLPSIAPYSATTASPVPHDWIHWQRNRDPRQSAILPWLGSLRVLHCPMDDPATRTDQCGDGPYTYSYVMNEYLGFYGSLTDRRPLRMSSVRMPSLTPLVLEEDENIINDGLFWPGVPGGPADYLSTRHDRSAKQVQKYDADFANRKGGTIIGFLDGHVAIEPKEAIHGSRWIRPPGYMLMTPGPIVDG